MKFGARQCFTHVCNSVHGGGGEVSVPACIHRLHDSVGGLCPGGLCQGDPVYGKEQAVHISLECILVINFFLFEVMPVDKSKADSQVLNSAGSQ